MSLPMENRFFLLLLQYLERRECEYDLKTLVDFYKVNSYVWNYHVSFLCFLNKICVVLISVHVLSLIQEADTVEPFLTGVIV